MKIAIGSDEKTSLTDFVIEAIKKRGHEVELFGSLSGKTLSWVEVGEQVALSITRGDCQEGILLCWTGTGASIAANKIPGARAALCSDARTAGGARQWNLANIMVMSLRLTSEPVALEILDAWFETEWGTGEDAANIARLTDMERKYQTGVYETAIRRRSIRRFKPMPVSCQVLERCVNAARLAPSAANLQPLEYIIVDDEQLLPQVFDTLKWAAYIRPAGDPPEGSRPRAYIVILKNDKVSKSVSAHDVGAAMENMILVALEEGIGSCPFAAVDRDKVREILSIPEDYEIPLVLALGYPDESPVEDSFDGSVKYWRDDAGGHHVPKRKLEAVRHWNSF